MKFMARVNSQLDFSSVDIIIDNILSLWRLDSSVTSIFEKGQI